MITPDDLPPIVPYAAPPDLVRLAIAAGLAEAFAGVENEPLPEPLLQALRELEALERDGRAGDVA
jgi:hypothetical protein